MYDDLINRKTESANNPNLEGHVTSPMPDDWEVTLRGESQSHVGRRCHGKELSAFREMFMSSGDWFKGHDDDPYVTFIVVRDRNPTGCPVASPAETDAMQAMSIGLITMLSQCSTDEHVARRVRSWCSSRIRKVVKRANGTKWEKLVKEAMTPEGTEEDEALSPMHGAVLVSDVMPSFASVLVFAPMRSSAQPKSLRRLQVSGLVLDQTAWQVPPTGPVLRVVLDESVDMTSGKAIAQAGHSVQIAFRCLDDASYARWADAGFHTNFSHGDVTGMSMAREPDVTVTDAGFTEVRPGTRTCAAWIAEAPVPTVTFD